MRGKQLTIYAAVKAAIVSGTYPPGELLPTEEALAKEYAVSRPTIAKVYNQLQDEGYIKKTRGFGTQVVYAESKRSYTIGLLFPGAGESEIFTTINDELLQLSGNNAFRFLWEGASANDAAIRGAQIEGYCNRYIEQQVDAILFSPLERLPDANILNARIVARIQQAKIPLVLVDRGISTVRGAYDLVWMDNFAAGSILAEHLIKQGCERILFFHRPNSANSVALRLAGVREAVLQHQLPFTAEQVICGDPADLEVIRTIPILKGKTGIVCANDSTAAILLSALEAIGVQVQSDYLVCGFDNMKYAQYLKYPLTTYTQPCAAMASWSIELAVRRIANPAAVPITVAIGGELIQRASTVFHR